jgi:hypothetical protein
MRLLGIAVAALMTLTLAFGQANAGPQQGGRQNNRMQQMGATMVQSAIDAIAAQSDPLQLIYRKDVQHDLEMDLGQRNKTDNFHDTQLRELQQARMMARRNPSAVNDLVAKQRRDTQAKIDELLTDKQKARLKQLSLQLQGNSAIQTAEVQKALAITPEQIQHIAQIKSTRDTNIKELQANVQSGEVRPQEITTMVKQIYSDADSAFGEVLTPEQAGELKKLFGPTFKPG